MAFETGRIDRRIRNDYVIVKSMDVKVDGGGKDDFFAKKRSG